MQLQRLALAAALHYLKRKESLARSKFTFGNLTVIKDLCTDLEGKFEAYTMDKVWSKNGDTVTVCFTCEKLT